MIPTSTNQHRTPKSTPPSSRRRPGTIFTVRPFYAEYPSPEKPMDPGLRRDDDWNFNAFSVSDTKSNAQNPSKSLRV